MRSLVLSGFAGTGKTTLGPLVAKRLGLPFVDTDDELARRAEKTVAEIWRGQGEGRFRELEAELVHELLDDGVARVLAFGGGTVTSRVLRHFTLDRAVLVTLTARPEVLVARLGDVSRRPTLAAKDVSGRVASLLEQRRAAYAECHLSVATDSLTAEGAAERVVAAWGRARVVIPLGTRTYRVELVEGCPQTLAETLLGLAPSAIVVVSDRHVRAAQGASLEASLAPLGVPRIDLTLDPGEERKTLASVEAIWAAAVARQVDRQAVVLGFGGGVVGDLAGFAASALLRGVRVMHAPTSLLAMVDASVGGKTGFDLPEGKNLIGTFHQPAAVVADLAHLATLPERDRVAGLAEVAKVALACDEALWVDLERTAEALAAGDVAALSPTIRRAIELKARLVRDDERETGARVLLNLGHTVGHALEAAAGYTRYRHGEAVALGLVAETAAAERLGAAPAGLSERVRRLLARMRLPTMVAQAELEQAWSRVRIDKKRAGSVMVFPVVRAIGRARAEAVAVEDLALALGLASTG